MCAYLVRSFHHIHVLLPNPVMKCIPAARGHLLGGLHFLQPGWSWLARPLRPLKQRKRKAALPSAAGCPQCPRAASGSAAAEGHGALCHRLALAAVEGRRGARRAAAEVDHGAARQLAVGVVDLQ